MFRILDGVEAVESVKVVYVNQEAGKEEPMPPPEGGWPSVPTWPAKASLKKLKFVTFHADPHAEFLLRSHARTLEVRDREGRPGAKWAT